MSESLDIKAKLGRVFKISQNITFCPHCITHVNGHRLPKERYREKLSYVFPLVIQGPLS